MKTETPAPGTPRKRTSARVPRPAPDGARKPARRGAPLPNHACAANAQLQQLATAIDEDVLGSGAAPEQEAPSAHGEPQLQPDTAPGTTPAAPGARRRGASEIATKSPSTHDRRQSAPCVEPQSMLWLRRAHSGWCTDQAFPLWLAQETPQLWTARTPWQRGGQTRTAGATYGLERWPAPHDQPPADWHLLRCTWTPGDLPTESIAASREDGTQPVGDVGSIAQRPARTATVQAILAAWLETLRPAAAIMLRAVAHAGHWLLARRKSQVASRRLRVVETVALGEKRFATLLHVDGEAFLIGGGSAGLSLLARLDSPGTGPGAPVQNARPAAATEPQPTGSAQNSTDAERGFAAVLRDRTASIVENAAPPERTSTARADQRGTRVRQSPGGSSSTRSPMQAPHRSSTATDQAAASSPATANACHSAAFRTQVASSPTPQHARDAAAAWEAAC